ncbi:MAG: hypothetical protein F2836_02930, partial [Actinobacteria bacterium]|nr:hypothetical protein [Actinomycetota bacterium]
MKLTYMRVPSGLNATEAPPGTDTPAVAAGRLAATIAVDAPNAGDDARSPSAAAPAMRITTRDGRPGANLCETGTMCTPRLPAPAARSHRLSSSEARGQVTAALQARAGKKVCCYPPCEALTRYRFDAIGSIQLLMPRMTMIPPRTRFLALGACAALLLAGCSSSSDSSSPAPADLQLPVAFGLVRDQAGLAQQVQGMSTPGSLNFMQWMTPAEIASTYGASQANAAAALSTLTAAGFSGALDPTGSALIGTMSAG